MASLSDKNSLLIWAIALLALSAGSVGAQERMLRVGLEEESAALEYQLVVEFVRRSDRFDGIAHLGGMDFSSVQQLLKAGDADIAWNAASVRTEAELQPIYFPIYRGLLGFRVSLVEQDKIDILKGIDSVDQLSKLWACQGKIWPDTEILEHNGLTIAKSLKYINIFSMLEADRCEYFPRGLFEPWAEAETHSDLNLAVDPHLLIQYPLAFIYYAQPGDKKFADHFNQILLTMVEDGTYERMFFADASVRDALTRANLQQRTVLRFDNPLLSDGVRAIPESLWYDPYQ